MTKQEMCWENDPKTFCVLDARRIVLWAGQLIDDNEEIGGIGQQLQRAARLLQLHHGVVWRAYQRRAGPEIYPTIYEARNRLIERLARQARPWSPHPLKHTSATRLDSVSDGYRALYRTMD